jgi:PAS domain S-box-containing protein
MSDHKVSKNSGTYREDEKYYDIVFETAGVALGIVETNSIITRMNSQFEALSGYTREEVEGKMKWTEFVLPEYLEQMKQHHVNRRSGGNAPTEYECKVRAKGGQIKYVRLNVKLVPQTNQSVVSLQDITELRQNEQNYLTLFESSITGIIIHDMEGNIVNVNNKVLELLGVSRKEFLSRHWGDSVVDDEKERSSGILDQVIENGSYFETTKFQTKDGRSIDVEIYGSIVEIDGTKYVQSHVLDITEPLMLEERYSGFVQSAPASFSIFDENLNLVDVNEKWVDESRIQRNDALGKNILDLFPYLKNSERYQAYKKILETGGQIEFKATATPILTERYFDIKAFKIKDSLGIISSEVTDKLQYQKRIEALHTHAVALSAAKSMDKVAEITQKTLLETLGFYIGGFGFIEENALVTRHTWGVAIEEPFSISLDSPGITVNAVKTGKTQNIGDVRSTPDFIDGFSNARTISELAVPVFVSGNALGVINLESEEQDAFSDTDQSFTETIAQHVASVYSRIKDAEMKSELEREILVRDVHVEQELELNKLKTRFMSTATHEIRTPLTSILGYTELITKDDSGLSPTQMKYFDVITRNTNRLSILTDDLLDIQRLEENRLQLNLEKVSLKKLIDEVLTEFNPILMEKNQHITCNCKDFKIKVDKLRIMQVVVNLLSNASKFSPKGSEIVIDVTQNPTQTQVSVKDQGIGIQEADIGKLFTPFPGILVDGNVRGTGLGLSICKGIIELHHGEIWVESEGLGKGSTFSFILNKNGAPF